MSAEELVLALSIAIPSRPTGLSTPVREGVSKTAPRSRTREVSPAVSMARKCSACVPSTMPLLRTFRGLVNRPAESKEALANDPLPSANRSEARDAAMTSLP